MSEFEVPEPTLPFEPRDPARVLGGARGQLWIADDFDAPLPDDVLADFDA